MKAMTLGILATLVAACGEEPPSCQQAIESFYGVGCTFIGATGQPTSQIDALNACQGINRDVPERCRDEFDDWKFCLDGVANDTECANCSQEYDALFACD